MIVLNTGIPKSGTTLLCKYLDDLLALNGLASGQKTFNEWREGGFLPSFDQRTADKLLEIGEEHGGYLIKCHHGLDVAMKDFISTGKVRVICNYRDPRDVVLSAIDHGCRSRGGQDPTFAFQQFHNVEESITEVSDWFRRIYDTWSPSKCALMVRYETMMASRKATLTQLAEYLNLPTGPDSLSAIFQKHEKLRNTAWNFNKGTTERWITEMNSQEKQLCEKYWSDLIETMGYKLEAQ